MYRGDYQLIGSEMSFFTRKLEAQLRCQQVPWSYLFKTEERKAELEAKAGTHFIPLLMTPDKWLIHDTIAIGPMLSDRFRERAVVPETPLQRAFSITGWAASACTPAGATPTTSPGWARASAST
jgi:glutathione S-transferase